MSKIIEKTVVSKYAPHDTNVDWLDVSGDKPVKKSYINGKWQVISGGSGSGSSNPTEADATKVWQVTPVQKGTKIEETVIVPEQTLVDGQDLEYNDKFVLGAQCVAVVNGVEYRGEVIKDKEDSYIFEAEFGGFVYNRGMGVFQFYKNTEPEVTASLSIIEETPIYDYNWAPGVKVPIPTAEDEGKILVVNKVEKIEGDYKEYELAPKQTVTITEGSVDLQNTSNLDKFVEGATVTSVINGIIYTGQVMSEESLIGQALYVEIDGGDYFLDLVEDGTKLSFSGIPDTYEISASILVKEYSYEYQLQENSGSGSSEKVITLNDWSPNGNNSYLIDVDGNRFEEGTDYTILYLSNNPSQDVFGTSGSIKEIKITNTLANIICDKIIVNDQLNRKWTKIPDFIITNNGGKVCWLYTDNNNITHECHIYVYVPSPFS